MGQSRVSILVIQGLTIAVLREMKMCLYWTTFQGEGFHCIYIMLFGFVTENAGFEGVRSFQFGVFWELAVM